MNNLRRYIVMFVALLSVSANAQSPASAEDFLGASGYELLDSDALEAAIEAALPATESVFTAAGQLSPLAKATYALEVTEGIAQRSRFHLQVWTAAEPGLLYLQLDRYNLGAASHAELVETLGAENVAEVEEFGPGPDVSWRLVTQQLMGSDSLIWGAARQEITGVSASCLGIDCGSATAGIDNLELLQELTEITPEILVNYEPARDFLPSPAYLLDILADATFLVTYGNEAGTGQLVAEAVLETGLAQEGAIDAAMRVGNLMDDSVEAVWGRAAATFGWSAGDPLFYAAGYECRRGAGEGGLCV